MLEITPWHERFLVVGLSKVWLQWKDFWIPFAYFLPTKYRKDANQNGSAESAQCDEMISNAQLACTQLRVIPEFNGQPVFFYLPVWETIRIATFSPGQRPPQMTMAEQDIASCAKNVGLWMSVVIFCRMTACWSLLQFEFWEPVFAWSNAGDNRFSWLPTLRSVLGGGDHIYIYIATDWCQAPTRLRPQEDAYLFPLASASQYVSMT